MDNNPYNPKLRNYLQYTIMLCATLILIISIAYSRNIGKVLEVEEGLVLVLISLPSLIAIILSSKEKYWFVSLISLWLYPFLILFRIDMEGYFRNPIASLLIIGCNTILLLSPIIKNMILQKDKNTRKLK